MEMKMIVVCPCGTKLRVQVGHHHKMRCPKCQTMLAQEIERQAARNSRVVLDLTALMLHDRLNSKRWSHVDEKVAQILSRYEIESHGGQWPPPEVIKKEPVDINGGIPLILAPEPEPLPPSVHIPDVPLPMPEKEPKSIRVKLKKTKKRGRR